MLRKSARILLCNWRNRVLRIHVLIVLYIVSSIGKFNASSCRNAIVAEVPKLSSSTSTFGEIHVLSLQQSTSVSQRSCVWQFSAPKDFLLNLHFINFTSVISSHNCNGCFAKIKKIFKGDSTIQVSGQYCGRSNLPGIQINGTVEIELQCNRSFSSYLAMTVLIEAATENCGGIFSDSYQAATLSYSASQYKANQIVHCVWYFDFSEEKQLSILVSKFSLRHDYSQRCGSEYLEIASRDDNGQVKFLSRKCKAGDYQLPVNFTSSGGKHFSVRIHSSKSGKTKEKVSALCFPPTIGYFDAYWKISEIVQKPIKISSHPVQSRSMINGLLFLKTKSENILFAILENFTAFCYQGTVHIWSDFVTEHRSNSSFCQTNANMSRRIFNTQSSVIIYYMVATSKFKDFNVTFFASTKGCGGAYQLTEGHAKTIKSEGYDQSRNYPANSNCRWLFLGSRTEFEVSILIMDLEVCGSCSCDYIKIEPFASKTPTYKLCSKPRNDYLIKGDMAVLFHSDGSNEDEGFVVNITAWEVCGREFYLLPGDTVEVVSPRYGKGAYPPNSFCQWNVLTSDTTVLNISVVDMDLEALWCGYYFYDYVEIFKGVDQNITLLHKICEKPSASIVLNGSSTIRFHSDINGSGMGFKMIIRAVLAIISKTTTTESPTTMKKSSTSSMSLSSGKRNVTTGVSVSETKTGTTSRYVQSSSKCCLVTTQTVKTKVRNATTLSSSKPTSSSKDKSVNQMVDKAPPSNDKLYIIGIVIPSALILCAVVAIIFFLRRRRAIHDSSEEKIENNGHSETDRWKKRQSSTVPLVGINGLQIPSSQDTSMPYIIENGCYGGTDLCESSLENENPYYSSNNADTMNNHGVIDQAFNPYYDSSMADYTCINSKDEQLYSEIHSKHGEAEYEYAANLGYQIDSADEQTDDSQYASIADGHLK